MLKAIHAQESKKASREKAKAVVAELRAMKLKEAAKKVEDGIEETLTYCDFPSEHWTRIRTNNVIERLNREIRRRTRVVGTFPDGNSALMLVCARCFFSSRVLISIFPIFFSSFLSMYNYYTLRNIPRQLRNFEEILKKTYKKERTCLSFPNHIYSFLANDSHN